MNWRSKNNAMLGNTTEHSGWLENMNRAVTFLEESLTGEVDVGHAAQIACCSSYHFQRIFSFLAGVPLSEYIRRRRMSLAAADLQSGEKIVDVALRYGYSSPTAFNRAVPECSRYPALPCKGWRRLAQVLLSHQL